MAAYGCRSREALRMEAKKLMDRYKQLKREGLKLDMSRGKPSKLQLDLVSDLLTVTEHTDSGEKTYEHIYDRGRCANSRKSLFAYKVSYNNAVNSGIKLLEKISEHKRKSKLYQSSPDVAFGHKRCVFCCQVF